MDAAILTVFAIDPKAMAQVARDIVHVSLVDRCVEVDGHLVLRRSATAAKSDGAGCDEG